MFSHEEYQALQEGAGLLDRRARGRLQLTGSDRRGYLHGLLTNDIAALGPGAGCYAALLTPQGRMVSDMRVSELGDRLLIDLPGSTAGSVAQRLSDFIFSEDVEVQDVGSSLGHLGLYGPRAAEALESALNFPDVPRIDRPGSGPGKMAENTNVSARFREGPVVVVQSSDYGVPGYELFVEIGVADELAGAVRDAGAVDVSAGTVDVCRVEAGRPEFGIDMDEHTIPLEAGIESRAISLTKGCYVGQEVIIRVLHRGQGRVARHLVGLLGAPGAAAFERGARLTAANGKDVGSLTSAVVSPRLRRPIGLGYVHRDSADPGTILRIGGIDPGAASTVTVVNVPFTAPAGR
jgi:folate-binding protein YgfZ